MTIILKMMELLTVCLLVLIILGLIWKLLTLPNVTELQIEDLLGNIIETLLVVRRRDQRSLERNFRFIVITETRTERHYHILMNETLLIGDELVLVEYVVDLHIFMNPLTLFQTFQQLRFRQL